MPQDDAYLNTAADNLAVLEEMYEKYKSNPEQLDPSWHTLFSQLRQEEGPPSEFPVQASSSPLESLPGDDLKIFHLIQAYRRFGHLIAKVNPIAVEPLKEPRQLQLANLGFTTEELEKPFRTFGLLDQETAALQEIIAALKQVYCQTIGWEYLGFHSFELDRWLQSKIEKGNIKKTLGIERKQLILQHLNKSELFEVFLNTKYVGQKRFSLEGGETLIPCLAAIIELGADLSVEDFILGMPHRGRLNVLSNILNKSYSDVFFEFEDHYIPESFEGSGDVKYHKGFTSELLTQHGHRVQVSLTPNPSHLESVDPVVQGEAHATLVRKDDLTHKQRTLPILIHGDAAIAGQGVVYETMQLCKLPGYGTGGTIHIVVNNQIGFTTLPSEARSTQYCTDIAQAFGAPVFHVNGEDPEACVIVSELALQIRQKFHCDVFIDLNCFRKYGHNETDEPAYTQPKEYKLIRQKKPVRELYRDDLIQQGVLERYMAEQLEGEFKKALQIALSSSKEQHQKKGDSTEQQIIAKAEAENLFNHVETGAPLEELQKVAQEFCKVPEDLKMHDKLVKLVQERLSMVNPDSGKLVDWGMGEALAYATLLWEGVPVRISGQDSCRGTFSHRHAVWVDQEGKGRYLPLRNLRRGQGRFDVYNSPLSEFSVLGFEFGYSYAYPEALVIWEAQFGDFANGAQVIIDQYIAAGEQKWGRKTDLVLFLPHGYEGQGPEHSSGRMERFLSLAGHQNMLIVSPSEPAQLFHLLRRQMLRPMKKPLIVFTPKGLLRHPLCVSPIENFTKGGFQEILEDPKPPKQPKKLGLCQGRIFYDLLAEREKNRDQEVLLVRVEQLYPLNEARLKEIIAKYPSLKSCFWIQEEPKNMGAWSYIYFVIQELLPKSMTLQYIGRESSAAPAVGSHALHKKEHQKIITEVFPEISQDPIPVNLQNPV